MVKMCQRQRLPRALETAFIPLDQRMYPNRKYVFRQIQHRSTLPEPPTVSKILNSSRLAAIFAGLEPARPHYLEHSAGESTGDASR